MGRDRGVARPGDRTERGHASVAPGTSAATDASVALDIGVAPDANTATDASIPLDAGVAPDASTAIDTAPDASTETDDGRPARTRLMGT